MACKDCGRAGCDGGCDFELVDDMDELEVTGVFSFKDKAIGAEDFNRLRGGGFDVEITGVTADLQSGDLMEIDLDIDDLVEEEIDVDPFAGPLVMLDGTVEEQGAPHKGHAALGDAAFAPAQAPDLALDREALAPTKTMQDLEPPRLGESPEIDITPAAPSRSQPIHARPAPRATVRARHDIPVVVSLGRIFLKRWGLSKRPICIGRGADQDIVLNGSLVSRRHCEIRHQGGVDIIVDVGSSNGTTVNGHPMPSASLVPGTVIGVGKFYLFYGPTPNQLAYLERRSPAATPAAER